MSIPSSESRFRRKTARACDQCRRRKTRCDGLNPCKPCTDTNLQCSHGYTIRQSTGPRYIAHLEHQVEDLQATLRRQSSGRRHDMNSTGINATQSFGSIASTSEESAPSHALAQLDSPLSMSSSGSGSSFGSQAAIKYTGPNDLVESLGPIRTRGVEQGSPRTPVYRGTTTGLEILRSLRHFCDTFADGSVEAIHGAAEIVDALDTSAPVEGHRMALRANFSFLPESSVRWYMDLAFEQAFVLWPFIDRDALTGYVDRLYAGRAAGDHDPDSMALLHMVVALGQRHDTSLVDSNEQRPRSIESRGIQHYAAARELVPLAECSRSFTAVQVVICMAIYLKSVSAQRAMHTHVSIACYAANQLGLHDPVAISDCSAKDRILRQQACISLRIFDAYVTSSLGLPCSMQPLPPDQHVAPAPFIDHHEMLMAANANAELLGILSKARERVYLANDIQSVNATRMVGANQLHDFAQSLEEWARRHPIFSPDTDAGYLAMCSKATLFLKCSHCYAMLVFYCPLLHHIVTPRGQRSTSAHGAVTTCVQLATDAISIVGAMDSRAMLYEAYALTVDVVAMAATVLLFTERCAPGDDLAVRARASSGRAHTLLQTLAQQNCAAARCLKSLTPLFTKAAASATAPTQASSATFPTGICPEAYQYPQDVGPSTAPDWTMPDWDFSQDNFSEAMTYDSTNLQLLVPEPLPETLGYSFDLSQ